MSNFSWFVTSWIWANDFKPCPTFGWFVTSWIWAKSFPRLRYFCACLFCNFCLIENTVFLLKRHGHSSDSYSNTNTVWDTKVSKKFIVLLCLSKKIKISMFISRRKLILVLSNEIVFIKMSNDHMVLSHHITYLWQILLKMCRSLKFKKDESQKSSKAHRLEQNWRFLFSMRNVFLDRKYTLPTLQSN